jgi:hypothetical protein
MARSAASALQIGSFYAEHVAWLCREMTDPDAEAEIPQPEELARKHHMSVEATISCWSAGFSYILDLGDEARRLTRNSPERRGRAQGSRPLDLASQPWPRSRVA